MPDSNQMFGKSSGDTQDIFIIINILLQKIEKVTQQNFKSLKKVIL